MRLAAQDFRIEVGAWNERNFSTQLEKTFCDLKASFARNPKEIETLCLVKESAEGLAPSILLNGLLGRLGRDLDVDARSSLKEDLFQKIHTLRLSGFVISDVKNLIPFFAKNNYPFLKTLALEFKAGFADDEIDAFEIRQFQSSKISSIVVELVSECEADQEAAKKLAFVLGFQSHKFPKLSINFRSVPREQLVGLAQPTDRFYSTSHDAEKLLHPKKAAPTNIFPNDQAAFHKNNWLLGCYDLMCVARKSPNRWMLPQAAKLFIDELFQVFYRYALNDFATWAVADNSVLENLYEKLPTPERLRAKLKRIQILPESISLLFNCSLI